MIRAHVGRDARVLSRSECALPYATPRRQVNDAARTMRRVSRAVPAARARALIFDGLRAHVAGDAEGARRRWERSLSAAEARGKDGLYDVAVAHFALADVEGTGAGVNRELVEALSALLQGGIEEEAAELRATRASLAKLRAKQDAHGR